MAATRNKRANGGPGRRDPAGSVEKTPRVATLLHPDLVIGGLSRFVLQAANPVENTLADLDTYRDLPADEIFPAPQRTPRVKIASRWQLPGLLSEDLLFSSQHEPLEPKFRRRYREQYRETHLVYARRIRPRTARTLLRWLEEQDERPVGLTGLSLGGALTLSLACIEERFAFAIPLIAHMNLAALVSDAPVLSKMRHDLKSFGWGRREFGRFVKQIGWDRLQPKLPPERMLWIAASSDRFFDPKIVQRTWTSWGKPAIRWYPTSHMGFLPYLPQALRDMRQFIDRITP